MFKKFISLAAVAASFFGCSGSSSSDGPSGPGAATLDDLPNCFGKLDGDSVLMKGENAMF